MMTSLASLDRSNRVSAIEHLLNEAQRANVRSMSPIQLIRELRKGPLFPYTYKGDVVKRLHQVQLDQKATDELEKFIVYLIKVRQSLNSKDRSYCDSLMRFVLEICPDRRSNPILVNLLQNGNGKLLEITYQMLIKKTLTPNEAKKIIELYYKSNNVTLLELLARHSNVINSLKIAKFLISNLTELYWKSRVLQAVLTNGIIGGIEFSKKYPLAFIYAVGRLERKDLLIHIKPMISMFLNDHDNLGLVIWTLGKIQAKREIAYIEKLLLTEYRRLLGKKNANPPLHNVKFIKHKYGIKKDMI